jgi:hypothetical protein
MRIDEADKCEAIETYTRLMEEDTETAQNRERLRRELHKLETALGRIRKLERSLPGYTTIPCQRSPQQSITYVDDVFEHRGNMEV